MNRAKMVSLLVRGGGLFFAAWRICWRVSVFVARRRTQSQTRFLRLLVTSHSMHKATS